MPKKDIIARFIGFDIDGSLLSEESKLTMIKANKAHWATLNRQRQAFAATFTVFFTSRQSSDVNESNRKNQDLDSREDPTSCFLPVKEIAEEKLGSTLCPVLFADAYSERADGYSYTRAVLRAGDDTAYHPGFVFDKNKTALLYMQAHIAANNMRNCDFLSVASRPTKMLQLACKSNAAYVFVEEEKTLLYVNKVRQEVKPLTIREVGPFNKMRDLVEQSIKNEEHDFECLHENDKVIRGITLSDEQLIEMAKIADYKHTKHDYLIIYEAFEDLETIMSTIHRTYEDKCSLLPRNVIIRLNQYSVDVSDDSRLLFTLRGTGPIDLRPKETVVEMAKKMLKKPKLQEEDFHHDEHCFSAFISSPDSEAFFSARKLSIPTVKHEQSHEMYALISSYQHVLNSNQITLITNFIHNKTQPSLLSRFFDIAPRRNLFPSISFHLRTLTELTNEEYVPALLTQILQDQSYSSMIPSNSKIDILLRGLDKRFNPKPLLVEEKHQAPPTKRI